MAAVTIHIYNKTLVAAKPNIPKIFGSFVPNLSTTIPLTGERKPISKVMGINIIPPIMGE